MKTKSILLVVILLYSSLINSQSDFTKKPNKCLKIEGIVLNANDKHSGPCYIDLFCDNEHVESITLKKGKKKFYFELDPDKYYTIQISRNNYLNKIICVDTKKAIVNVKSGMYFFSFETSLLHVNESTPINVEFSYFPIAIISFNPKELKFDYNKEYTKKLKRELQLSVSKT